MAEEEILKKYREIDKSNEVLRDKKNELEYILNRYHEVISKIELDGVEDDDKILITTVKDVFSNGNGNINNLIDRYVKNIMETTDA